MKLGISSYSLSRAMTANEMTIWDVIEWISEQGAQHIEIVPVGFDLTEDPDLPEAIRQKAKEVGIEVSNYAIGANFIAGDETSFENEIKRVMGEVDIAYRLGVRLMRHDVAYRSREEASVPNFLRDLPRLVEACRRVADYAAQYGIVTSVENHGFHVQGSERVQQLIYAVDRPNFRTTLDVGNFMCVDENSAVGVKRNIGLASMVHLKDFYLRPSHRYPGVRCIQTVAGNYLRGAIVGQGDIDILEVMRTIKTSGYDGYISIEFEGREECRYGTKIAFDNALRIWNEV